MNIFQQNSYKDVILYLGKTGPTATKGFYRKLSEHLGVHPTFISQVLSGDRDFSEEQLVATCDYLGLQEREIEYLLNIIKRERAGSKRLRDFYQQQVLRLRNESELMKTRVKESGKLSEKDKAIFYSSWQYSAVHMMSTLIEKPTFSQIQDRLSLTRQQTQQVLRFLIEVGLVKEKNGKYTEGAASTYLEKTSPYLFQHHVNWRFKALEKFAKMTEQELMYTSNFSISRADFSLLRGQIMQLIQACMANIEKSNAEDLGQLNIDLLWV